MTDDLDRALRATLTTAARQAPDVEAGLLDRVESARRRRRRIRTSAAAAAVAVVLGGTGAVGALLRSGEDAPPAATTADALKPMSLAGLGTPVKLRERWPDAVRTVPSELPNGRVLEPVALLDGDTLVGATTASLQKPDKLWSYDLAAHQARVITDIVVPPGSKIFASDFAIGQGQVIWWLSYRAHGRDTVEIWGAPVAGGAAHKIVGLPGASVSTLLIDGGTIVWGMSDGIHKAPLAGGAPTRVPGTAGYEIVSWPWIGSPAFDGNKEQDVTHRSLWNLRTGEHRKARLTPLRGTWSCAVTWCVGDNPWNRTISMQRRDGKAGRTFPTDMPGAPALGIIYERFVPFFPDGLRTRTHVLYDLRTGKLIDTGIQRFNEALGRARNDRDPQRFIHNKAGTTLIDFSKIT
ncbi:hypothetical protein [Actinomadura chibensis]|uniref:WD40 repeat domain-containing protein n=1 Tax=Actinomadura chibensis TaxID=392828 RepID=A0A5D0NYK8_9ACTN|nr:hypothetical protein [Actinomadura chibensis]TYB49248.1 hypothetical protein FXF69_09085 [Actinomadura chibensis]